LFTNSCETVDFTGSVINGGADAHYDVTGATPGATYIVSVKYDVKSIIGAEYANASNVSKYVFASYINGLEFASRGSTGTIDAVAGCTDNTPLPGNCSLNLAKSESESFKAYPVPFDDVLTVEYKYEYETDVQIQVYDTKGLLITRETDTQYRKGEIGRKHLDLSRVADQALIIRLITNNGVTSKMVISKSIKK